MNSYLNILEVRAEIEGIELYKAEIIHKEEKEND
jgi:hypothetical protein